MQSSDAPSAATTQVGHHHLQRHHLGWAPSALVLIVVSCCCLCCSFGGGGEVGRVFGDEFYSSPTRACFAHCTVQVHRALTSERPRHSDLLPVNILEDLMVSLFVCLFILQCVSRSVLSESLQPHGLQPARLLYPWNSPGKNTGVGRHFLLQGIFPTQRSNPGLLHCRQIVYQRATREARGPGKLCSLLFHFPSPFPYTAQAPTHAQTHTQAH